MRIAPDLEHRWEHFKNKSRPGLIEAFSIRFTEVAHGLVKASMPISDAVLQPFGMLHGGASVALAESVASLGSWMLLSPESETAAGLEINANHLRPVHGGSVHAQATIVHQGRKTHVWNIIITDDHDKPVCISRCTISIIPGK